MRRQRRGYRIEWWRTGFWPEWYVYHTRIVCIDNGREMWPPQAYKSKASALSTARNFSDWLCDFQRPSRGRGRPRRRPRLDIVEVER